MNTGEWIGILVFTAGLLLYLFDRFPVGGWLVTAGHNVGGIAARAVPNAVRRPAGPTPETAMEARLDEVRPGQFVQLLGTRHACTGKIVLGQLLSADDGNTWEGTGNEFRIIQFGTLALVNIPTSDDGNPVWFSMKIGELQNLVQFIAGTKNHPGPATKFADSNMQADVTFHWQKREWQVVTLGECRFDATAEGRCFVSGQGQLRYMLAKEVGAASPDYWLAIDKEDGKGGDVLFVGPQIDVDASVEDIV